MQELSSRTLVVLAGLIAYIAITSLGSMGSSRASMASQPQSSGNVQQLSSALMARGEPEVCLIEADGQSTSYRSATTDEVRSLFDRDPQLQLHVIDPDRTQIIPEDTGLQITLMGTAQLDGFPQAKAAFTKAAANWKAVIRTPISIIINVDFGPAAFGASFPTTSTMAAIDPQIAGTPTVYPLLRRALIAQASSSEEASFYNSLPADAIVTDRGATTAAFAPSAVGRATTLLPAVADPASEALLGLGPPPSIAFNSTFQYTFDPSGGISAGTFDFDAIATRSIGYVLGFHSLVGDQDLHPSHLAAVSVLDLFRFRPGTTTASFGSAMRILSPGGDQAFFFGTPELPLSTARQDGSGGDGNPAGNWKSSSISGSAVGLMDPHINAGERRTINDNDLRAFEAIGYKTPLAGDPPPLINSLSADLQGNSLVLTGAATDPDGDITQADITLLDTSGKVVSDTNPFQHGFGGSGTSNFTLSTSAQGFPTALTAALVLIDGKGHKGAAVTADFSHRDANGPQVNSGAFDASGLMSLKGSGFDQPIQLESNGTIVAVRIKIKGGGTKLKGFGSSSDLNLATGPNRIRVLVNGLRSNIFVLTN